MATFGGAKNWTGSKGYLHKLSLSRNPVQSRRMSTLPRASIIGTVGSFCSPRGFTWTSCSAYGLRWSPPVVELLAAARRDADFIWLDREAFSACEGDSIDYAVMEHTPCAAVV